MLSREDLMQAQPRVRLISHQSHPHKDETADSDPNPSAACLLFHILSLAPHHTAACRPNFAPSLLTELVNLWTANVWMLGPLA